MTLTKDVDLNFFGILGHVLGSKFFFARHNKNFLLTEISQICSVTKFSQMWYFRQRKRKGTILLVQITVMTLFSIFKLVM